MQWHSHKRAISITSILLVSLVLTQCTGNRELFQIDLIPATQSLSTTGETVQYTAIGHFTHSPATQDITNEVTWQSSDTGVATISPSGLATATGFGETTIVAFSLQGASHSRVTAQASLVVGAVSLPALLVVPAGSGSGVVTSVPVGIDCGPSTGTCTAHFVLGTTVTLTATPNSGSTFGSWSACDSTSGNACTVTMNADRTVTVTFN